MRIDMFNTAKRVCAYCESENITVFIVGRFKYVICMNCGELLQTYELGENHDNFSS